jgi:MFS family permease
MAPDQFHSLNDIGWYGSAFFLTVSGFQASWGKAYKYFDMKSVFLTGILIFELGSLLCGVSRSSTMLIIGRAITGVGAAGVITGSYCIVAFAVPPVRRPAFTGIMGATYGVASVLGPLLGGAFTDSSVTWRFCFYINLPIGAISVAIIFFMFESPAASKSDEARKATLMDKIKHMDILGMVTIMAAIVCLLLALQWGGVSKSWKSADVIGTLVGFGVLMIAFVVVEYLQGDRAMLVPSIMKQRVVLVGSLFSFL